MDPMTALSFLVSSKRGVYVLLIGSGVSRSAGVPTGWDITVRLVNQLARAEGHPEPEHPEAWYRETFGAELGYSALLDQLASTSAERRALLAAYFQRPQSPDDDGPSPPSAAHQAIARLVLGGWVKVIVTTNFDSLIEDAITAAGGVANVLPSADAVAGAQPLAHLQRGECTILNLHGDYRDDRTLNTPEELSEYPDAINERLDQILDEYGLIVCGGSAEWDPPLRDALDRAPNRRYTTYWALHGEPTCLSSELEVHS
jgi:hypothetical protein